jgi:iron(III) transport system substrate-binding protein
MRTTTRRMAAALVALLLAGALSSCGSDGDALVIYSGRNENLIRPLLDRFAEESGIDIKVRYGDTSELLPTILEEGEDTRADVFFSQDAGALAALSGEGFLAELPEDLIGEVDERFRDPEGRWVGVTARARVIAYNTDALTEDEVPESPLEVTDPKWRGEVGYPPTNASFIAMVSALREQHGDDVTREFLEGLEANDAKRYDNNVQVLEALAEGEIQIGLVNHYYLYNEFKNEPDAPVANHYPGQEAGGEGTFVNIAGVGIVGDDVSDEARAFLEFLLSEEGQSYFREETAEYPVAAGIEALPELPPLADLRTIDVPLTDLGKDLEGTVELLREVGLS